jgi:site-specific recombinase XerD
MTTIETSTIDLQLTDEAFVIDDAQLAAVAFLARYNGRTLDAYSHDLRGFFQWASDNNLAVLAATRPHIELYRSWMVEHLRRSPAWSLLRANNAALVLSFLSRAFIDATPATCRRRPSDSVSRLPAVLLQCI